MAVAIFILQHNRHCAAAVTSHHHKSCTFALKTGAAVFKMARLLLNLKERARAFYILALFFLFVITAVKICIALALNFSRS